MPPPSRSLPGALQQVRQGQWPATQLQNLGMLLLIVALLALFAEVFKSTFSNRASLIDHLLSLLLFIVLLLEFLLWPAAGNPIVALLMLMALVDVISGFAVGMAVARRDIGVLRD